MGATPFAPWGVFLRPDFTAPSITRSRNIPGWNGAGGSIACKGTPSSDKKALQDFAAAIFLVFEEGRFLTKNTTVLSYVWTSARHQPGQVIENPYLPGMSQMIVLQAGDRNLGRFVAERRNVPEDYRRAFGKAPPMRVSVIALFTDNDQTREPVETYYGAIRASSASVPTSLMHFPR